MLLVADLEIFQNIISNKKVDDLKLLSLISRLKDRKCREDVLEYLYCQAPQFNISQASYGILIDICRVLLRQSNNIGDFQSIAMLYSLTKQYGTCFDAIALTLKPSLQNHEAWNNHVFWLDCTDRLISSDVNNWDPFLHIASEILCMDRHHVMISLSIIRIQMVVISIRSLKLNEELVTQFLDGAVILFGLSNISNIRKFVSLNFALWLVDCCVRCSEYMNEKYEGACDGKIGMRLTRAERRRILLDHCNANEAATTGSHTISAAVDIGFSPIHECFWYVCYILDCIKVQSHTSNRPSKRSDAFGQQATHTSTETSSKSGGSTYPLCVCCDAEMQFPWKPMGLYPVAADFESQSYAMSDTVRTRAQYPTLICETCCRSLFQQSCQRDDLDEYADQYSEEGLGGSPSQNGALSPLAPTGTSRLTYASPMGHPLNTSPLTQTAPQLNHPLSSRNSVPSTSALNSLTGPVDLSSYVPKTPTVHKIGLMVLPAGPCTAPQKSCLSLFTVPDSPQVGGHQSDAVGVRSHGHGHGGSNQPSVDWEEDDELIRAAYDSLVSYSLLDHLPPVNNPTVLAAMPDKKQTNETRPDCDVDMVEPQAVRAKRDFALQHMCEYGICARKTGHGLFSHSHLRIFYLDPNHQYLHWHPPPLQSSTTEGVAAAVPEFSIGDGTTSYVAVTSILRVERGSPNQHDKKYLTVLVDYDTANSSASSSVSTSQVRTEKTRHSSMILTGGIAGVADSKSLTLSMNTDSDVTMFMDCLLYLRKRKNAVAS